jgi:ABC-type uncharacterized transport system involved in gliding motility auxiliary subunit
MTKKQQNIITLLSVAVLLLLLLLSRRLWARLDLTSHKAYTLSSVSKNLYKEIEDNLRITYFISNKLQAIDPTPSTIADILREYEARSRGKIKVTVKDPGKDGVEAERYGLYPQQLQNVDQGEASFSVIYSGVVIEYLNRNEVMPWVFSMDTLEYDITSRIRSLVTEKRRELGIMTPEYKKSFDEYYSMLNQAMQQGGFIVTKIGAGEEIPDTLPALFIFGGVEELDERALYRIDRYIQLGGRVFFGVEGVDVDYTQNWDGWIKNDKGLLAMISTYGVTVGSSMVLDRAALPLPFRDPSTGQYRIIRYPAWISVLEENGNPNHPLTSGFSGVDIFWASPLTLNISDNSRVKGEVLFSTSPEAWTLSDNLNLRPDQSAMLSLNADATRGQHILAVALEGYFPRWYTQSEKPEPRYDGDEELPDMPSAPKETRIVVVGDADLGGAMMQYTQGGQQLNPNFLMQAADWLGNDDDIIGIRNRTSGSNRLDRIIDEDKRAGLMRFSQTFNTIVVPLLIVLYGVYRVVKRNRKKEQDHAV